MEKEKINISYETLWKVIIRPPIDTYEIDDLGDEIFSYRQKIYVRKDYDIVSSEGHILKGSFIEPRNDYRPCHEMPVVIYLHGNSSSRLEGLRMLDNLLDIDVNLFVFDFAGCGISEGEYISLGFHEKDDLKIIVDFVDRLPGVGNIALWGRSMGAATSMLYSCTDERICGAVVDSPFADFYQLSKELVLKQAKGIPNFIIETALAIIKRTIKSKNGLDISKLRPIDCAKKTHTPLYFIHAMNDELIGSNHTVELSSAYNGNANLYVSFLEKGGHNSIRPRDIIKKVIKFFRKYLKNENIEIN